MDIMTLFLHFFNIGVSASVLALFVMLLRVVLKKAPKGVIIALWALVAIRLILPFSIESPISLMPNTETIPEEIISVDPTKTQEQPVFDIVSNPIYSDYVNSEVAVNNVNSFQLKTMFATFGWLGVAGLMLFYMLISYLVVRYKIRLSAPMRDNIYLCDNIDTPFVFGLLKPRIYLPSAMNEEDMKYVIAHEKVHLKRKDYIWKPLGFILLSFYWFSPALWISYALFCKDIELACDESVIKTMGSEVKKAYSNALVNCSVKRKLISACPLAFGEVGVKNRVKAVLNYKKPTFWILLASTVALFIVGACFMTSPETRESSVESDLDTAISEAILELNSDKYWVGECPAEGHIVLGTENWDDETRVYLIVEFSSFGFTNGWFINQNSYRRLVNMGFKKSEDGYKLGSTFYDVMEGTSFAFPEKYRRMAENLTDKDLANLWSQCESYAKAYLKEIGREAKIGQYGDMEHILLTDVGVSVDVSNRVVNSIGIYNAGEIGFFERVENGVRYIYRTSYLAESNRIVYTKEFYGTGELAERIEVDASTGNVLSRTDHSYYFDAKVIKTEGERVLVEPHENSRERRTSDKIWVSTNITSDTPVPSLYDGLYIRVVYDGMIQEVYPAIVPNTFAIYLMADINYIGNEAKESETEEHTTRMYSNPPTTTAPNIEIETTLPTISRQYYVEPSTTLPTTIVAS